MGGLFKSKTKVTKTPFENNPWEPQQEYLKSGFESAQNQLDKSLGMVNGITDPVANLTQSQLNQIGQGIQLGNQAQRAGQTISNQGQGMLGQINQAASNLNQYERQAGQLGAVGNFFSQGMNNLAQQTQGIGNNMANAGLGAFNQGQAAGNSLLQSANQNQFSGVRDGQTVAQNAYNNAGASLSDTARAQGLATQNQNAGVNQFNQIGGQSNQYANQGIAGALAGATNAQGIGAQANQTAANINQAIQNASGTAQNVLSSAGQLFGNGSVDGIVSDAQKVADNPYLQRQIDAATGDVARAFQQDRARINSDASASGNMNSSRAGVLESRALEAATRQAGDIASSMRSDAYNTGLNTATANKGLNNNVLGTQLGAGGLANDVNNQRMDLMNSNSSNQLNANQQYMAGQAQANQAGNANIANQFNSAQGAQGARDTNLQAQLAAAGMNSDIRNSANQQAATGYGMAADARNNGYTQQNNAYNTQLGSYEQLLAGLQGQLGANQLSGGLLGDAGNMALAGRTAGMDALMNSTQLRNQMGQAGAGMMQNGYNLASQGNQNALASGSIIQQQRQNEIDGRIAQAGTSMDLINQYMAAVGGSYGSQGFNSTATQSASPFQQIMGGVSAGLGALSGFK